MRVEDVMSRGLKTIEPNATIREAAKKMLRYEIGGLIVTSAFIIKGIITERDILDAFAKNKSPDILVSKIMTKKVHKVSHNTVLEEAAKIMLKYRVKRLPVVKDGKCVGIVTATDLITYEGRMIDEISLLFLLQKKQAQGA
ncbi:MAG: CBS domain-containing protein [Candidatus Aenigmarchaeota archaeon]|nr:CBS domain-containing protein [Candidatus Aenigmarchaeota archaeon]